MRGTNVGRNKTVVLIFQVEDMKLFPNFGCSHIDCGWGHENSATVFLDNDTKKQAG